MPAIGRLRRYLVGLLGGLLGGLLLPGSVAAAGPAGEGPYAFVTPPHAAAVNRTCQAMLVALQQAQGRLARGTEPPDATMLAEIDAMTRRAEDTLGPLGLLAAVSPRKAIRDAADACERRHQAQTSSFLQNAAIHARLRRLEPVDEIDRRFLRDALDAFEDAGVALAPERQRRARQFNNEMTALTQRFERRIREDRTRLAFLPAELDGVPPGLWREAPRDRQGRVVLGLDQATVFPILENATSAATRERLWRTYLSQGGPANIETLAGLVQRRLAYARLFGRSSYADFVLRRRMALSESAVQDFLSTVKDAVQAREIADLDELRAEKARHLNQRLEDTTLQRWDTAFYAERVRRAVHAVDQEQFRRHFPPEASLRFAFRVAERLFGIRIEPLATASAPLWHPDARAFVVTDVGSPDDGGASVGALLGTLFVDLYPRPDKFNHAAVWGFRNSSTVVGRRPAAALVVNFNREGLTLDELETLLHEFGHALHGLLSQTRYAAQGGTNVQLDFVEAPSQMLEDWVYDPRVLQLFAEVCPQCVPVPDKLLAQARAARDFGKGAQFARQHLFASYDLALHGADAPEPLALWARMEGATPLGHVRGTMFPAGFEHIAGGYAAGYYGYLWSLVLAEDLRTAFAADRLDARVGRRYRATVLENGGQVAPDELLRRFLGRPTDSRAFFDALQRPPR